MLTCTVEDGVAILAIDDGKANAIGEILIDALNDGLDLAEHDAKAVLLVGRPNLFCAGFDLKILAVKGPRRESLVDAGARLLLRLFTHPQPIVAACTGHAVAGGALMLLASDFRLGTAGDYRIGLNETAIDVRLDTFAVELVRSRVPPDLHFSVVLEAQTFRPDDAVRAGFLDRLVEADELLAQSMADAQRLAILPQRAFSFNKLALRRMQIRRIEQSLTNPIR